jgi:hypothetical protein
MGNGSISEGNGKGNLAADERGFVNNLTATTAAGLAEWGGYTPGF